MVSALVDEVLHGRLDFEQLEKLLWNCVLDLFRRLMVEVLEEVDEKLMKRRDRTRFIIKERNPRSIQTLLGGVDFRRRYYWDNEKDEWVYLLDEALKIEAGKTIGPGLLELAVTWATKGPSYRDARDLLKDLYGAQVLSHEAIRQALLEVGAACKREEENQIITKDGKREVKVLFIETDGFYVRFQENQKRGRLKRKREVKLAVIHEGWAPRHNGKKKDYKLVNPTYVCSFEEPKEFWEYVRGIIHAKYRNADKILIVINGDGAEWIRQGLGSFANVMYQYDRFHIARDIRSALRNNKKALRKAQKALKDDDMGTLLYVVTEAWSLCKDAAQKEELEKLRQRLVEDWEYIVDYRARLKQENKDVPAEWRGLGAAESDVDKFKNRTGKRGRAWSQEGIEAMLMTLARLYEGTLQENVCRTMAEKEEWLLDKIKTGVGHIVKATESKHTGVRRGSFPATRHGTRGFSKLFSRLQLVDAF